MPMFRPGKERSSHTVGDDTYVVRDLHEEPSRRAHDRMNQQRARQEELDPYLSSTYYDYNPNVSQDVDYDGTPLPPGVYRTHPTYDDSPTLEGGPTLEGSSGGVEFEWPMD